MFILCLFFFIFFYLFRHAAPLCSHAIADVCACAGGVPIPFLNIVIIIDHF